MPLGKLLTKDCFDSRLDAKLAAQRAHIDKLFAGQNVKLDKLFAEQNANLDKLFTDQNAKFDGRFDKLDQQACFILVTQSIIIAAVVWPYVERLMSL